MVDIKSRGLGLGARLASSVAVFALAAGLALAAAHWYEVPKLGSATHSLWAEPDVWCSLTSSALALGVALSGRRTARHRAPPMASLLVRALLGAGLTLGLLAAWAPFLGLLALLVAPTHALAGLRLFALWQSFWSERLWRRF